MKFMKGARNGRPILGIHRVFLASDPLLGGRATMHQPEGAVRAYFLTAPPPPPPSPRPLPSRRQGPPCVCGRGGGGGHGALFSFEALC